MLSDVAEAAEAFIAHKNTEWQEQLKSGRANKMKDIGRKGTRLRIREAWTWHVQHNYSAKALLVERFRYAGLVGTQAFDGGPRIGDVEYRFGYWIVGRIGRTAGQWRWGQFSPIVPHDDLKALLAKAREERTLLE